jgi:hypothetical protein
MALKCPFALPDSSFQTVKMPPNYTTRRVPVSQALPVNAGIEIRLFRHVGMLPVVVAKDVSSVWRPHAMR